MKKTTTRIYLVSTLLFSGSLPAASLDFVTPSATVGPNDIIEVWVRLSAGSTPIHFDASDPDGDGTYGDLDLIGTIPTGGWVSAANSGAGAFVAFDTITSVSTNTAFLCSGSFTGDNGSSCSPGANYELRFNVTGPSSFNWLSAYSLGAGQTEDFLFGTFEPLGAGAQPGTYDFSTAFFFFDFDGTGTDDEGVVHDVYGELDLAETCPSRSGCFTRDVVAQPVPVPAAAWLLASALGLLGAVRRMG